VSLLLILSFVLIFALVMLAVSLGLQYFEGRRKQNVSRMLRTVEDVRPAPVSNLLKELEEPRSGGLQRLLDACNFSSAARARAQQAGLRWTPSDLAIRMAALAGLGALAGSVFPVLVSRGVSMLAFAGLGACLPYLYVRRKATKRLAEMESQLPEALDFLARSMRAGHAFTISLEMLGEELADPLGQEFRALSNEQNLGAPLETALGNFTTRVPLVDARFFASSILLQRQTGGNLSEILMRLAYLIRERFRLKGQVKAASAHGRLTATILTVLPVATMLGLLVVAPGYLQGMATDSDGRHLIVAAVCAQVLGNFCIKKIIRIKV